MRNAEGSVVRSRSRPRGTGIVRFPSRRSGVARQPLESFRKRVYNNASVHQRRCARLLFWKTRGGRKRKKRKKRKKKGDNKPLRTLSLLSSLPRSFSLTFFSLSSFSRARKPSADTDSPTTYTCTCTRGRAVVRERIIRLRRESARPSSLLPALSPLSRYLLSFSLSLSLSSFSSLRLSISFSPNLSERLSLSHRASSACFASIRLSLTVGFSHSRRPSPSRLVRPVTSLFFVGRE